MTNSLTIPIDAATLTTSLMSDHNNNTINNADSSQANLSTAGKNYTNYYFLRSHLNQGSASSLNTSASTSNLGTNNKSNGHDTAPVSRTYNASNQIKSASTTAGNYDTTPNYRNYLAAQDRAQLKLNNYLAKNLAYYDNEQTNSSQSLNRNHQELTTSQSYNYPSAYLQPELKAQLLSAQSHVPQSSALLIQAPSYYNTKSKSVSHIIFFFFYLYFCITKLKAKACPIFVVDFFIRFSCRLFLVMKVTTCHKLTFIY